ncbi:MAG TPA: DUF1839 family protein [Mycobacteriales bacterium]
MSSAATPAAESGTTGGRHPIHDDASTWPEINCYVDLWIELLHSRGYDPLLACGFVFDSDLDGRQWSFHKYDLEDLLLIYGVRVVELNVWRSLSWHIREQLAAGRLLTVEVDAFHLPDTYGVSYQLHHVKTTVAVDAFDPDGPSVGYFHNRGRYETSGADTVALLRLDREAPEALAPYVETISFDHAGAAAATEDAALERARVHVRRRAVGNPVTKLGDRLRADVDWLVEETARDEQACYDYAFGTVRQCGAGAQIAARYVEALGRIDGAGAPEAVAAFDRVATTAKSLQFILTRRAHGRRGDLDGPLATMTDDWATAMAAVVERYG